MRLLLALLISQPTWAANVKIWEFSSKQDKFTITAKNNGYFYKNKEVDWGVFEDYLNLFEYSFSDPCPYDLKKPDLTITVKSAASQNSQDREFFISKNYVRFKDRCVFVGGEGLASIPTHRNWFVGPTSATIDIKKDFKLEKDGKVLFDFYHDKRWQNKDKQQFVNWDYFRQIRNALTKYPIQKRIHPSAVDDRTSFTITTRGKTYTFYQMSDNVWALLEPKKEWLFVSSNFAIFGSFDLDSWTDKYSSILATLSNKDMPQGERMKALQSLKYVWTPAIKKTYHHIILDRDDLTEIKISVVKKLKRKPTDENMKVLVKALSASDDVELLNVITKTLRVRNPKGPVISDDQPEKTSEYIKQWQTWVKGL